MCVPTSYLERKKTTGGGWLLPVYLFATCLTDACRVRTLFSVASSSLTHHGAISAFARLSATLLVIKALMLATENTAGVEVEATKEARASFISKMFFWWLKDLLWTGFRKPLEMEDLDDLGPKYSGRVLGECLSQAWQPQERPSRSDRRRSFFSRRASSKRQDKGIEMAMHELGKKTQPDHDEIEAETPSSFGKRRSLLLACFLAFPREILAPVVWRVINLGATLSLPFLVSRTLAFAESYVSDENAEQPAAYGWGLVGAYGLVYLVLAFSTGQFQWLCNKVQVKLRGALIETVYRKSLRLHLDAAKRRGGGAAANLTSVDIERFARAILAFHTLWTGFLIIGAAAFLLYRELGLVFLATIFSILLCLIVPPIASNGVASRQTRWSQATDRRINLTSSAIANAKGLKFMAYEQVIEKRLLKSREEELRTALPFWIQLILVSAFTNLVQEIMTFSTFITLYLVDRFTGSHNFNVNTVVTSLTLMQILEIPLLSMGQYYGNILSAYASLKRIEEFLLEQERPMYAEGHATRGHENGQADAGIDAKGSLRSSPSMDSILPQDEAIAASFKDATIGWNKTKPILVNVTATIPHGELTMLCGTLGCGKSTFLLALLGEADLLSGSCHLPIKDASIAYVAQDSWLQEGISIKDNIIFDGPFNGELYHTAIYATGLTQDLDELSEGDQTLARSLSGGQRQRVALARAVYLDAPTYILDDVTSALDAETAAHVWKCLLGSQGMLKGKTVVLATNALHLLHHAAHIIRLDAGKIVEMGRFEELSDKGKAAISRASLDSGAPDLAKLQAARPKAQYEEKADDKHEEVESGSVRWRATYGAWAKAIGTGLFVSMLLLEAARAGSRMGWNFVVQIWARYNQQVWQGDTAKYLSGFTFLIWFVILSTPVENVLTVYGLVYKAGKRIHAAELHGVLYATMRFFDETAPGRIINRFGQDIYVIDYDIPIAFYNLIACSAELFGQLLALVIPAPYILIAIVVALVAYIMIQRLYAPPSTQLRRLEMATKSPIYTLFAETSSPTGLATLRAAVRQPTFETISTARLDKSQAPYYYLWAVRRWLLTWLNLLSLVLNVALVAIVVILRHSSAVALLGVGLVQATQISQSLNQTLIAWTEMEIAGVALERMLAFAKLEPEETKAMPDGKMRRCIEPSDVKGQVDFKDVSIAYVEGAEPALKKVNFSIRPGERIGVCGRSGSGKSTLLLGLFRMLEPVEGEIQLDGIPISRTQAHSLRNSMTIVPQNALLLADSVRNNLDPGRERSDAEIWTALDKCRMQAFVQALPRGLDTLVASSGSGSGGGTKKIAKAGSPDDDDDDDSDSGLNPTSVDFSAGQRQLFSLARALLRQRKVLVLDEATSSMDYETDGAVQEVLRTQFEDCTMITVAHRIATVRDYDRILVLGAGKVVEFDTPDNLVQRPNSVFRALAIEQGCA